MGNGEGENVVPLVSRGQSGRFRDEYRSIVQDKGSSRYVACGYEALPSSWEVSNRAKRRGKGSREGSPADEF